MTNQDKKILTYLFCGVVGAFVFYLIVNSMFLSKVTDANDRAASLTKDIELREIEDRSADKKAARLKKLARQTLGDDQYKIGTDPRRALCHA